MTLHKDESSLTDTPPPDLAPWFSCLRHVARHYRIPLSEQAARQSMYWDTASEGKDRIGNIAQSLGLRLRLKHPSETKFTSWQLPMIVALKDGQVIVVTAFGANGDASVTDGADGSTGNIMPADVLFENAERVAIARPLHAIPDERVDAYIKPYERGWFRKIVLRDLRPYGHVMIASLVANLLGLAGILFSMQVYDRVVPAKSFNTLYVLFSGVLLALVFDFIMRKTRMSVIDMLGKRADIRMSDLVFGHALRVKNKARPVSTGTFIAQLRELEQVRDMLTSTTVTAIADIPFFIVFLTILFFIGGALAFVPLVALILLIVPGVLYQRRLRAASQAAMRESSLRNAVLVEAVQGIEDIKTLQAEDRFQQQWNHLNAVTGDAQLKQRNIANTLNVWTFNIQTAVYASTIFVGAPMVMAGEITTGVLVGSSVLASRMMGPMAQITQVLSRLQQAKIGLSSLNDLMRLPVDHAPRESRIHLSRIAGNYRLSSTQFHYDALNLGVPALLVKSLSITGGEKIALLGKNGAGKSTLLQGLSGMLEPSAGEILLDSIALKHIDPADLRRDVAYLSQNATLFFGTIRENLLLGAPNASSTQIIRALEMTGAAEFIHRLPRGLDHQILEGGRGLSGGQKQALLLARLMLRDPSVVLLDEPTASMDEATERHFLEAFGRWSAEKTVVIATHRMRVLDLVNRLIVVDQGAIVMDEKKEIALQKLRGISNVAGSPPPANAGTRS
ncbi:type I secretion system permease/ATPase [Limoniibacter endophyticus]|uniref:ATP-binding protein n=1 Tax=Limoniibacter endophyticus TaxID=1565040 RepID=A0A8J3GGJ0_9HYPH|nr:type I secretion system permease/ATPase [Limoniibacter endophyticus]GHC73299.1 ATP-binding protein [Limoniibacter endophyticus]